MRSIRAVLIASLLFVPTLFAHHDLEAQFDTTKTVTLTGAVTKIVWGNPHVRLSVQVKDDGSAVVWDLYMGSPNLQMQNGWKIDSYRLGDRVSVEVYPARDGSNVGYAKKVALR